VPTNGLSKIRFPVIRSIEINGYALFPGTDGTGLSHRFENGVSVIAGINGLGKTTLLNALLRSLIGPYDVLRESQVT
jgi:DNA repair exonuclease SbcCD ATPase subunit